MPDPYDPMSRISDLLNQPKIEFPEVEPLESIDYTELLTQIRDYLKEIRDVLVSQKSQPPASAE